MSKETSGGLKTRTDLLNYLADTYGLKRYLEIGLQRPEQNFDKIRCGYKVSVDPDPEAGATYLMTSDEFFRIELEANGGETFDLIFIDGLHEADQVETDFRNACYCLKSGGFIVIHDCNPQEEWHTIVPRPSARGHWNGDVYKFATKLNSNESFHTVDIDNGCGVFAAQPDTIIKINEVDATWAEFNKNRKELLKLISWDEFTRSTVPHVQ